MGSTARARGAALNRSNPPGGSAPAHSRNRPIPAVTPDRPSSVPQKSAEQRASAAWDRGARWARLARRVGLEPEDPLLIALSGGADSVLLLHLASSARPRPPLYAVHVEHELRGAESRAEAEFCAHLCARLGVPFVRRRVSLDPRAGDLEARARRARYGALAAEARRLGLDTIATGHHADDALETLVMRWLRGTELFGLAGLKARARVAGVTVVRPLIDMRREEVREELCAGGLAWREDSSNRDLRFTRNRVRHQLLPGLRAACGADAIENLRAFGRAVETLEQRLAAATAHVSWRAPAHAAARRSAREAHLGGTLSRAELMRVVPALRRRVLWRLLSEGSGRSPSRALLEHVLSDLQAGRCARHHLPGSWVLQLRSDLLHLSPPAAALAPALPLPLPAPHPALSCLYDSDPAPGQAGVPLAVPGLVDLPDGRAVGAEWTRPPRGTDVPRSPALVELEAHAADERLALRWPRPGDRFHGLGAPGTRPLARFLADAGVPREERARVPLVFSGDELVWVAGMRPCESRRVRPSTELRLRLTLHNAAEVPRASAEIRGPLGESGATAGSTSRRR